MKTFLSITFLHVLEMIIVRTTEASTTYLIQSHMTWSSAVQSCNKKGGSLLTDVEIKDLVLNKRDSTNLQYKDARQTLASPEFWIKEFKYKSPWLSAKGCFSGSSSDSSTQITLQRNTVGKCYQSCNHSDYFATQGTSCKCLTNRKFQAFTEENGTMCNVACPGDKRGRCGGPGVYDMYKTVDTHPNVGPGCQQSKTCDCVGLRCVNSEIVYFSDDCKNTHMSGCSVGDLLFIRPPRTWSTLIDSCVSVNGRYPITTLNGNHSSTLCGVSAWIGIFRLDLVSKGSNNCPYCRLGGINGIDLSCSVTECHVYRSSVCRYREDNTLTSNKITTTVPYGILIGVLIGVLSCIALFVPIAIFLKRRLSRQRYCSGTGGYNQVYFTASGGPSTSHVYDGLEEHDYVELI